MNTQSVLFEVAKERGRQDEKWGGPRHDDSHSAKEFAGFIAQRAETIRMVLHMNPEIAPNKVWACSSDSARSLLIEIAALAVAAVESIDRKATP